MRRMVIPFVLLVGMLTLAASGLADPGDKGKLQTLRRTILEIVPDAEQVISYRVPAFYTVAPTRLAAKLEPGRRYPQPEPQ